MADWTYTTLRDAHLDEHNAFDHTDLASLTNTYVLGVDGGAIKQLTELDIEARVDVKKNGASVASRRGINFVEGSNITLTISDDSGNEEVDVTITGEAGGSSTGGMPVAVKAEAWTVSEAGIYLMNSTAAGRVLTLPALSTLSSDGMRVIVKRYGVDYYVDVDCNAADEFEPGGVSSLRLFTNWSALSLFGSPSTPYWMELGFYGGIS